MFVKTQSGPMDTTTTASFQSSGQSRGFGAATTAYRASLVTAGICCGAAAAVTAVGEFSRTQRIVALGSAVPVESVRVDDFEYVAQTSEGDELRIPKWVSFCVPAPDHSPSEGSVTPERIISEWPAWLPESFAWNPVQMILQERYYIVLPEPDDTEDIKAAAGS